MYFLNVLYVKCSLNALLTFGGTYLAASQTQLKFTGVSAILSAAPTDSVSSRPTCFGPIRGSQVPQDSGYC